METAMIAYFDFLLLSVCVIFQETLPEMALTNFSLKEKTNTVGNNTTLLSINLLYYINANTR